MVKTAETVFRQNRLLFLFSLFLSKAEFKCEEGICHKTSSSFPPAALILALIVSETNPPPPPTTSPPLSRCPSAFISFFHLNPYFPPHPQKREGAPLLYVCEAEVNEKTIRRRKNPKINIIYPCVYISWQKLYL
jgi:hypothetical protein